MSSKRRVRRISCEGKARYISQRAAERHLQNLRRAEVVSGHMTAYKCKFCNGFHFGHTPRKVRQSMAAA